MRPSLALPLLPALASAADQQLLGHQARRPNIVFILTDDQDLLLDSLEYQPLVRKHLAERGTSFNKHFCTTAVCCPSRVSLLTGKLAHNTNVTDVNPPYGGYPKFVSQGFNDKYLPVWLQEAGYDTYYTGKLFNALRVDNYNAPFPGGWTQSDFLLDPHTYDYLNATYQRNRDAPVSYEGRHSTDVLAEKTYGLLEAAAAGDKPFFLGVAPVAPHSNVRIEIPPGGRHDDLVSAIFSAPVPADRHAHLFPDVRVPRTPHFNPEKPSGASWIRRRPRLDADAVDAGDHFYRQRLRALQGVDELVEGLVTRLEKLGLLDDTYIFYTADNGYHVGQHRLLPGKQCGYDEDINVPLLVRGPGVPENATADIVTTHTDLAPTLLRLAGAPLPDDLDGEAVPLTAVDLGRAAGEDARHEHVTVEYWGFAAFEGGGRLIDGNVEFNNTYKAVRIAGERYSLYYSVWCSGEHELYDLQSDPYQLHNLLENAEDAPDRRLLGLPLHLVADRLDALLLVLKSCRGRACVRPWAELHPGGDVRSLADALEPRFDSFYGGQARVRYDHCEYGYLLEAEGPQFERDGQTFDLYSRYGVPWHEWV